MPNAYFVIFYIQAKSLGVDPEEEPKKEAKIAVDSRDITEQNTRNPSKSSVNSENGVPRVTIDFGEVVEEEEPLAGTNIVTPTIFIFLHKQKYYFQHTH